MPREPDRMTQDRLIELAARGLGKVDLMGPRGATLCSMDEIIAMAGLLGLLGLRRVAPGDEAGWPPQALREVLACGCEDCACEDCSCRETNETHLILT
jgi:hypothetical protein